LTTEGGKETLARSLVGSLSSTRRESLSLKVSGTTIEEEIEENPIIVDELPIHKGLVYEETMVGARVPDVVKVRGSCTLLVESLVNQTSLEVIVANVTAHFKRKKVFTTMDISILVLVVKASSKMPILFSPTKTIEAIVLKSSAKGKEFDYVFSHITLSHALFAFLALNEKERWVIEGVVSGRFGLGKTSFRVVKELERNLTIPLNFL